MWAVLVLAVIGGFVVCCAAACGANHLCRAYHARKTTQAKKEKPKEKATPAAVAGNPTASSLPSETASTRTPLLAQPSGITVLKTYYRTSSGKVLHAKSDCKRIQFLANVCTMVHAEGTELPLPLCLTCGE